jgi:hypothetical protein
MAANDGRRGTGRARRVFCEIARAVVDVTLRSGRGFHEAGRPYVRCDERDCQYVDRNEPPCPLRVGMFSERGDQLVREYLAPLAGAPVCYRCVSESLRLTHEQVRSAVWRLAEPPGWSVDVRPGRCVACRQRRMTMRLTPPR